MKINIPKFQGGSALPLVDYMPYQGAAPATAPEKGSEASSDAVGLKDILKLADQLDGLHNDMDATISSIKDLYANSSLFTNGDLSATDLVTTYLSALQKFKVAKLNKEQFNEARELVTKNGGLHEVAIDSSGNLLVQDNETGKLMRLSAEQYNTLTQEQPEKYEALTNEHLLWMRDNEPSLAFRNDILSIVSNGIGQDKVTKMIQDALANIGSSSLTKSGYTQKQADNISSGLEILAQAHNDGMFKDPADLMPIDSLYKIGYTTKDQQNNIQMALKYLYKTMPQNAKTWLALKSQNVTNPEAGARDLLATLMFASNESSHSFEISPVKDPNKKEADPLTGDSDDKANPYFNMAKMIGGYDTTISINTGTSYQMEVDGKNYSSLPGLDNKPVGATSVDDLLNQGLAGIVTDRNAITFGDQLVSSSNLANIMYDNAGGTMAILPCKMVSGHKVVDLELLPRYQKAQKEINDLPKNMDDQERMQEIAKIFVENDLMQLLDPNTGLPNKNRFYQFLIVDAYGVNKGEFLTDSDFVEEVDDPDPELVSKIEASLSTNAKKDNYKIDVNNWYDFNGYDHIYKASMYIPITNNELQMVTAFDGHAKHYYEREQDYQLMQKRAKAATASSNVL